MTEQITADNYKTVQGMVLIEANRIQRETGVSFAEAHQAATQDVAYLYSLEVDEFNSILSKLRRSYKANGSDHTSKAAPAHKPNGRGIKRAPKPQMDFGPLVGAEISPIVRAELGPKPPKQMALAKALRHQMSGLKPVVGQQMYLKFVDADSARKAQKSASRVAKGLGWTVKTSWADDEPTLLVITRTG